MLSVPRIGARQVPIVLPNTLPPKIRGGVGVRHIRIATRFPACFPAALMMRKNNQQNCIILSERIVPFCAAGISFPYSSFCTDHIEHGVIKGLGFQPLQVHRVVCISDKSPKLYNCLCPTWGLMCQPLFGIALWQSSGARASGDICMHTWTQGIKQGVRTRLGTGMCFYPLGGFVLVVARCGLVKARAKQDLWSYCWV